MDNESIRPYRQQQARRAEDITRAWGMLTAVIACQSVTVGGCLALVAYVVFDGKIALQAVFLVLSVVLSCGLYVVVSRAVTQALGDLLRLLGEPAKVRDSKTGRFIPISTTANRDRRSFLVVEE